MGDPTIETFDEANVEWVPFDPADPSPVVPLVRAVLAEAGAADAPLVRVEAPPRSGGGRGLLRRRRSGGRPAAQIVGPRPGMPIVLTVGDETDEPVGRRFGRAGIVLPDGWSLGAPNGTFPWVDVPGMPDPEVVVRFVVDALGRLGAGPGEWRAGIDRPGGEEHGHGHSHGPHGHSHGPHGHHSHGPGDDHGHDHHGDRH
jgi:hypothetical protein